MNLPSFIDRFLFQRISSRPFIWMRTAWALVLLGTLLMQWNDVAWFYSRDSFLSISPDIFSLSAFPRFSLFHIITDPAAIFALYILLLTALICILFGFGTRFMLILSILLLHSFHYRNPLPLGGGDIFLYNIGFLLMVSPMSDRTSFARLLVPHFLLRNEQPENQQTISIWSYRLLLFQIIVLYLSSLWWKLLGTTWIDGTAIEIAFRNPEFARFALPQNLLHMISPIVSYLILLWEFLWILLLIPHFKYHELTKKTLIITGIFFHLGILLFLKVGSFSLAMLVAYSGLWDISPLLRFVKCKIHWKRPVLAC